MSWKIDVGEKDFEREVVERSREVPVVVDFWAPWCQPCHVMGPILEGLAEGFAGAFVLAKVDVEEHPGLADRYAVQAIPTVVAFRDGEARDAFAGVLPEEEVKAFIEGILPSDADRLVREASSKAEGSPDEAASLFRLALEKDPARGDARIGLARIEMARGDDDSARELLSGVDEGNPSHGAAKALLVALGFRHQATACGGKEACRARLAEDPDDNDARFGLACALAAGERYEEALENFLGVIERDKRYRDGAAKEAMVSIFELVGQRSELADRYRSRLARALY